MNAALLGEGPSDRCLLPILRWLLGRCTPQEVSVDWVDTTRLPAARTLSEKVRHTLLAQPCDLLFIHRDSDNQPVTWRYDEIRDAAGQQTHVGVVPIRMMEAWLLLDESAIRAAAGRVSGREPLRLPSPSRVEDVANPKHVLREALLAAHASTGRRKDRFDPGAALYRVADLVEDWEPLRQLSAFQRLEADTLQALNALHIPTS